MERLRHARHLARIVLAWLVLAVGLAAAAPVLQPASLHLVCTGAGELTLVVEALPDDRGSRAAGHSLDCPWCPGVAPPPVAWEAQLHPQPLGHVLEPIPSARIAAITAAPLPARGPPTRA